MIIICSLRAIIKYNTLSTTSIDSNSKRITKIFLNILLHLLEVQYKTAQLHLG